MTVEELFEGLRRCEFHLPRRFWRDTNVKGHWLVRELTGRQRYIAAMSFQRWQRRMAPFDHARSEPLPSWGVGDIALEHERIAVERAPRESNVIPWPRNA
jgi:hypothetical protein